MPVTRTHKKAGWQITLKYAADELTQGQLEAFMRHYASYNNEIGTTPLEDNGKTLRAAILAGWIDSPALKVEDVPEMKPPAKVRWLALQIDHEFSEARTIPPE